MKNYTLIILLLLGFKVSAQFMNPGRGIRQSPTPNEQNQQNPIAFNAEKAIGITYYDVNKTAKKLGIKKNSETFKKLNDTLVKFNKDIKDISRINSFTFSQAKIKVEGAQKLATESRDFTILKTAYKEISEDFKPIVEEVEKKEKNLDSFFKMFLTKKQFIKWEKYKLKLKTQRI